MSQQAVEGVSGGTYHQPEDSMKKILFNFFISLSLSSLVFSAHAGAALLPFTSYDVGQVFKSQNFRDSRLPNSGRCGNQTTASANNGVFFLGDSLMFGLVTLGELLPKAEEKKFTVFTKPEVVGNRVFGKSVEATSSHRVANTITNLATRTADFDETNAGTIVIGLGTNREANTYQSAITMIDYIRSVNTNPQTKIYWINTYFSPDSDAYKEINEDIDRAAEEKDFTVIDFASEAMGEKSSDYQFNSDKIHHTSRGYTNKATFVLSEITGPGSSGSSCVQSGSGDNEKDAMKYLIETAGYTPIQAAGIVANFVRESGVNPVRAQCIYTKADGIAKSVSEAYLLEDGGISSKNLDQAVDQFLKSTTAVAVDCKRKSNIRTIAGMGWGLVQWTPFSKMRDVSLQYFAEEGTSVEEAHNNIDSLFFQLEFLIGQLRNEGVGGRTADTSAEADLRAATTLEQAAVAFASKYERCGQKCEAGGTETIKRVAEATRVLESYGSQ